MQRWQKITVFTCVFVAIARLGLIGYALSPCDFDDDGVCDATDIVALLDQGDLIGGVVPSDPKFDLTGDGLVNMGDLNQWFREAVDYDASANHMGGDANLDGAVDRIDLNLLSLNWLGNDKVWSEGDFTGDGQVNAADLMSLGINWQRITARDVNVNVPEPANWLLVFLASFLVWTVVRQKFF